MFAFLKKSSTKNLTRYFNYLNLDALLYNYVSKSYSTFKYNLDREGVEFAIKKLNENIHFDLFVVNKLKLLDLSLFIFS